MKIERINENQIRCTLTSLDLSTRNINLLELAYGTEKAKRLFREMIQRASNEVGFDAEDIPLMVEAIPLSGESIMLVITKIEDPEELDTRFSKFSPFTEEDDSFLAQTSGELLEGAGDGTNCLEPGTIEGGAASPSGQAAGSGSGLRIFRFDRLDRISEAARAVSGMTGGESTLYKKPETRQYYLVVRRQGYTDIEFSRTCNILAEYSAKLPNEGASEAYFKEHYETLIREEALQNLAKI